MEFKTAALIGAGAVGAFFIRGLSRTLGDSFCVIADGERAARLRNEGLLINGEQVFPNVCSPAEAAGADLILVATKYSGLPDVIRDLRHMTAPHTTVVSALNGVDSEEILAEAVGEQHLLHAYMVIASQRVGNRINYNLDAPGLIFGEKDKAEMTPRAAALDRLLEEAGISHRFSTGIRQEQWQKFALNMGNNLPQAVLNVGYEAYVDSEHVRFLHDRLFEETILVAEAYGIEVVYDENRHGRVRPEARFSTLQDLDAGRRTEIDMFAGVLMQKAAAVGIEVPYTTYTYHAIRALEEKNEGKIH
ncbi:MAG: 2-dehydropantoate 2-reductase [Eubacteriales bacterium]|nr:2-dehydropantoate 2-reductase [Eubacteriales bacterium]